jgi:hypothetical protein
MVKTKTHNRETKIQGRVTDRIRNKATCNPKIQTRNRARAIIEEEVMARELIRNRDKEMFSLKTLSRDNKPQGPTGRIIKILFRRNRGSKIKGHQHAL